MCRCQQQLYLYILEEIALINTRQAAERIIIRTQMVERKHTHTVQPNLPVFL